MCAFFKLLLNFRTSFGFYLLFLMSTGTHALDYFDNRLQVHGFFSQGMIKTSDNNFLGDSHNVSFDFREIALNASYRALPNLQFSSQLMSHFAGASDTGGVDADYAFVDWTVASGEWGRGGIRAGRVKNPYGLYNTTRFVPFTRPGIILPQSIYFERTRKLAISSEGAEFYFDWLNNIGTLGVNIVLGWPNADDKATEVAFFGRDFPGKPDPHFTQLYQLNFEGADKNWRVAATLADVNYSYISGGKNDPLKAGEFNFTPYIFSAQYEAETWSFTTEYAVRPSSFNDFGLISNRKITGESFYVQATYNLLPKIDLLTRYDVAFLNRADRDGETYAAQTGRPAFTQFSMDWTLGIRYDITPAIMLRAEYHNIDGTAMLPTLDNPNPQQLVRHWDMGMVLVSFRF